MIRRRCFVADIDASIGTSAGTLAQRRDAARDDVLNQINTWDADEEYQIVGVQESEHVTFNADDRPFWVQTVVYFRTRRR